MAVLNSSLQPWPGIATQLSTENNAIRIPRLRPCVSSAGPNVSCYSICQNTNQNDTFIGIDVAALFDPTKTINLINCGLFWTAICSLLLGGSDSNSW